MQRTKQFCLSLAANLAAYPLLCKHISNWPMYMISPKTCFFCFLRVRSTSVPAEVWTKKRTRTHVFHIRRKPSACIDASAFHPSKLLIYSRVHSVARHPKLCPGAWDVDGSHPKTLNRNSYGRIQANPPLVDGYVQIHIYNHTHM